MEGVCGGGGGGEIPARTALPGGVSTRTYLLSISAEGPLGSHACLRDRRTATLYSHATPDFKLDAVGNLRPQGVFTLLESRSYRRQVGIRDGTSPQSAGIPTPGTIYTPQYLLLSALLAGQMRGSCSI